jgi:hypothetical protein
MVALTLDMCFSFADHGASITTHLIRGRIIPITKIIAWLFRSAILLGIFVWRELNLEFDFVLEVLHLDWSIFPSKVHRSDSFIA